MNNHAMLLFILLQILPGLCWTQDVEFEKNVNLLDRDLTIDNGRLWITDTDGPSTKTNIIFMDGDKLTFNTNLLNTMTLDESASLEFNKAGSKGFIMRNGDSWTNGNGPQLFTDNSGVSHGDFILATRENLIDGSGINGNGAAITMWSPCDDYAGLTKPCLIILDEDALDNNNNPYDDGAIVAWLNDSGLWTVSDANKKKNLKTYKGSAAERLNELAVYTYEFKERGEERQKDNVTRRSIGLMAQEVEKVIPQAVTVSEYGEYFINYNQITPVLIQALKEKMSEIEQLQNVNDELIRKIEGLETKVLKKLDELEGQIKSQN